MVFIFKRVFVRIVKDGERKVSAILKYLESIRRNRDLVKSWVFEAIDNICDQTLKAICLVFWAEIKELFGENDFDLYQLFKSPKNLMIIINQLTR